MGASLYSITEQGFSAERVFDYLVEDTKRDFGPNSYAGTIATTSLGREVEVSKELQKAIDEDNWDVINDYEHILYPEKRITTYTKKVNHYKAYTPKWHIQREKVKRQKGVRLIPLYKLIVEDKPTMMTRHEKTLTEAKRSAKELALKHGSDVKIQQFRTDKNMINIGTMVLETDGKEYKSKRSSKTRTYLPTYDFEFFVCAAN